MMQLSRTAKALTIFTLGLVMAFSTKAEAGRKPASIREPASVSREKAAFELKFQAALAGGYLRYKTAELDRAAKAVKDRKSFEKVYLQGLGKEDREAMLKLFDGNYRPIPYDVEGDVFIFRDGKDVLRVRLNNLATRHFTVNGVDWIFNPKQSLVFQLEILQKKLDLEQGKSRKSALVRLLEPDASAQFKALSAVFGKFGGVAWAGVGAAGSEVAKSIVIGGWDAVCSVTHDKNEFFKSSCSGYRERAEVSTSKELVTKSVKLDAVERAKGTANETVGEVNWIPKRQIECPSAADSTRNIFESDMIQVTIFDKGKKMVKNGDWFALRMEFTPDLKPKSGMTADKGTNLALPDASTKARNIMTFDERGILKEIRYRNTQPRVGSDPAYKEFLTLDLTTDDTKMSTEEKAIRDQFRSLVKSLNEWITYCMNRELIGKFLETNTRDGQTKKPPQPAEAVPNPPTAPRPAAQ